MTSIIVIEEANPSDVVRISKNSSLVSPLKAGFKEGDEVTIETLLYAALLRSANDAAVALAEAVAGSEERFVYLMNRKAEAIGLKDTKFINPHGLPGPDQHTTAFDLSIMMRYALRYPKLKEIIGTRVAEVSTARGNDLFLKNTNKLLWSDEDLIGGKTGYTRQARHCFVCAAERETDTVIVTLLGSPSRITLWKETETLIDKGFNIVANKEAHVYRSLAIADALRDSSRAAVAFLMTARHSEGLKTVAQYGYAVRLAGEASIATYLELIRDYAPDVLINDLASLDAGYLEALSHLGATTVNLVDTLDDLERTVAYAQVIVSVMNEERETPENFYGGPAYAILRRHFRDTAREKEVRREPRLVVLTFGGSDPQGLTLKAARALAGLQAGVEVVAVAGPAFSYLREFEALQASLPRRVPLMKNKLNRMKGPTAGR